MARNDVVRVSAPNTTDTEKVRRESVKARQDAEISAEMDYYRDMMDPNNQSAEAMAMRDGPVESLTPDVVGMIALGKPTEWAMRAAAPYVAKGIGMVRPMFVRGGRGMRNAVVGVNDGVYVGADAAVRAGDPADIKALYEFFAATDRVPFAKMNQAERDALVKATGWQQLPTGEVVKQIPKFEFNPKTWKHYEQYATGLRRRLSKFGGSDVETALGPKSADGTVRGAYFEDVFSGPGAEQYFKYYPDARKYVMRIERNANPKLMGEARGDEILLTDSALDRGVKQVVDTMHHEPAHIIQADSALSSGGDLSAMGNVLRGLNGATDEAGNLFSSLPLKGVPETGVDAFRKNTQKMYRALMESQKLVKPSNDPALNALQRLAAADETDAKHFMYRHLGGEAGAHAVGHSASAANPPLTLAESMSEIGINPQLVYDFAPAKEVASRAYRTTDMIKNLVNRRYASLRQAAKGGDAPDLTGMSNFLATDKVPDSIFGIPVVSRREDYTEADLAFFRDHPEAGGYYSMGDEGDGPSPEPPEDGGPSGTSGAQKNGPAEKFITANPTLFGHVKSWETLRLKPYEDIGGYAIGYGAHLDADGNPVTAKTRALADEAAATALLARDLMVRRDSLKALPGWSRMSGGARQALLDVSMGKDGILSEKGSPGLWRDLRAAGSDRAKLDAAVKRHYVSYLTDDPKYRGGLMSRRAAGMKTFFGEDWSYDGKTWDDARGFVTKGAE